MIEVSSIVAAGHGGKYGPRKFPRRRVSTSNASVRSVGIRKTSNVDSTIAVRAKTLDSEKRTLTSNVNTSRTSRPMSNATPQFTTRPSPKPVTTSAGTRADIRSGVKLPPPYTYAAIQAESIEEVPLNSDFPSGQAINHAAGRHEQIQWYRRYKLTYGRQEYGRQKSSSGFLDFRPLETEVVGAKRSSSTAASTNRFLSRRRPTRIGKPVRRSVGLSKLWPWDSIEWEEEGWVDCEASNVDLSDHCSVSGSIVGSVASSSMFTAESMKKPGAMFGFGGYFAFDNFLRPENDPYYSTETDDDSSDEDDVADGYEKLLFAALPYSLEWQFNQDVSAESDQPRTKYPTQQLVRTSRAPTVSRAERIRRMNNAARIKARQNKRLSRVSDWRHHSAALEAEANRRRALRDRKVDIKEIFIQDDASTAMSVDVEEVSLPGVLQVMAMAEEIANNPEQKHTGATSSSQPKKAFEKTLAHSKREDTPNETVSKADASHVAQPQMAHPMRQDRQSMLSGSVTDASNSVDGTEAYLSESSTIINYLLRRESYEGQETRTICEVVEDCHDTIPFTSDGLEEDSREDSAELYDEDDADNDDSLVFSCNSKTSIGDILAVAAATNELSDEQKELRETIINDEQDSIASVPYNRSPVISSTATTPDSKIIEQCKQAREAWDTLLEEKDASEERIIEISPTELCITYEYSDDESEVQGKWIKSSGESTQSNEMRTASIRNEVVGQGQIIAPENESFQGVDSSEQRSPPRQAPLSSKQTCEGVSLSEHLAVHTRIGKMKLRECNESIRTASTECSTAYSEDFVPSPVLSSMGQKMVQRTPYTQVGVDARSRRRALEAQWSKRSIPSTDSQFRSLELRWTKTSSPALFPPTQAKSIDTNRPARDLKAAVLHSLKDKVSELNTTDRSDFGAVVSRKIVSVKSGTNVEFESMMKRIQSEKNRVSSRSRALKTSQPLDTVPEPSTPDWNVW